MLKSKTKKLAALCCAIALMSTCSVSAFATNIKPTYTDGDREVEYYDFDFIKDGRHGSFDVSDVMVEKKFNNRHFVVTVSSRSRNQYPIGYYMMLANSDVTATGTAYLKGTGNGDAAFNSRNTAGNSFGLAGRLNQRDINNHPTSSGQFSPDAAR